MTEVLSVDLVNTGDYHFSKIYNSDWDIVAFKVSRNCLVKGKEINRLLNNKLMSTQENIAELNNLGIYFLLNSSNEVVYIGQGSIRNNQTAIFSRILDHDSTVAFAKEKYFDKWDKAVIVVNKYAVGKSSVAWNDTTIRALEAFMISIIKPAYNRTVGSTCGNDMSLYNSIIEHIKVYLGVCGVQSFKDSNVFIKQKTKEQFSKYNKFERVSSDNIVPEIVTPERYVDAMLDLLPSDVWNDKTVFLDPACKKGEFLRAIYDRLMAAPALVRRYPNITNRALHILSRQVFGVAISEESRQLTINLLSDVAFDLNIKCIEKSEYIKALKAGKIKEMLKEAFGKDMNIDVVIGNPPYNEDTNNNIQKHGIYNLFVDAGTSLAKQYVSMIIPSRWMTTASGGISNEWISRFRTDRHIRKLVDYIDSKHIFSGVYVEGGVCYFLYDVKNEGTCERIINNAEGKQIRLNGELSKHGIVLRDDLAIHIIDSIISVEGAGYTSFSSIVQGCTLFYKKGYKDSTGYDVMHTNWNGFSLTKNGEYDIKYYINSRVDTLGLGYGYVAKSQIPNGRDWVSCHKVYHHINHIVDTEVIDPPFYGEPNSCSSMTYRIIGTHHETAETCNSIIKYMKTKFFRYIVALVKVARNINIDTFCLVPMQNFRSDKSDIDWSQSIDKIDKQLYAKYKLTQNEINVIESTIKEMR